jgi:surfactin synthase thioesterase subunit
MQRYSFVLVPGAGGDAWYWHLITRQLEDSGHETLPVDLPAADERAGLPEYVDAVIRAIGGRDPTRLVVVAQSLGGFTAPLVCHRVPAALLVLVNALRSVSQLNSRRD